MSTTLTPEKFLQQLIKEYNKGNNITQFITELDKELQNNTPFGIFMKPFLNNYQNGLPIGKQLDCFQLMTQKNIARTVLKINYVTNSTVNIKTENIITDIHGTKYNNIPRSIVNDLGVVRFHVDFENHITVKTPIYENDLITNLLNTEDEFFLKLLQRDIPEENILKVKSPLINANIIQTCLFIERFDAVESVLSSSLNKSICEWARDNISTVKYINYKTTLPDNEIYFLASKKYLGKLLMHPNNDILHTGIAIINNYAVSKLIID